MKFNLVKEKAAGFYLDPGALDYEGLAHVAHIFIEDVKQVTGAVMPFEHTWASDDCGNGGQLPGIG